MFWIQFTALCLGLCIIAVVGGNRVEEGSLNDRAFMCLFMMGILGFCVGAYASFLWLVWHNL